MTRSYYTSSARNFTPDRMTELRQSNFPANRLPYQQGYLLAAHWNLPGNSLDLVMRSLLKENRESLSNARIVKALRAIGIGKAEEEVRRFVVEGKTIELRANLWGACATAPKPSSVLSTWASTGQHRIGPRSFKEQSRTAMPGGRVFVMAKSGPLLMLTRQTRRTWPRLRLKTNKGSIASSTTLPRRTLWWLRNTRPVPGSATPQHSQRCLTRNDDAEDCQPVWHNSSERRRGYLKPRRSLSVQNSRNGPGWPTSD